MTALCGGGTSAPTVGASAVTLLASGFLAVALDKYGVGWLKWALPFLSVPELTLSTFCASDPPAIPTFTAAESKALIDVQLGADFDSGLSKFLDLVKHLAWRELCNCTSGALVAYPGAPAPPAGTPIVAPRPAVIPSGCQFVPGWAGTIGAGFASNGATFTPGLNPTTFQGTYIWSSFGAGPHPTQTYTVSFSGPGLPAGTGTRSIVGIINTPVTMTVPVPAGATSITQSVSCTAGGTDTTTTQATWLYCGADVPGVAPTPCCPPDAATALQLESILRLVTLMQRQLVPFAYISSTAHAGLTGAGSFAVQGLLGVRIDLTTLPASFVQDASVPPFIFSAGWVSALDANGFINEVRSHSAHQVWFPAVASDATLIGYSFAPGIVATITELLREP